MYVSCIILVMVSFMGFVVQGMDRSKPTPAVVKWITLARDAQKDTRSLFKELPKEIESSIFAQIHPHQTVDEWMPNASICVQKFMVPGIIYSFDISGDNCAYFSKQKKDDTIYALNYADLVTGSHRQCITTYADRSSAHIPGIAVCSDRIVYEDYQRRLMITNFKGEFLAWVHAFALKTYQCHSTLPLVALVDVYGGLGVYNVNDCTVVDGFLKKNITIAHECLLQWHPVLPILAVAYNGGVTIINSVRNTSILFENCLGDSSFSFDGNQVVMDQGERFVNIHHGQGFTISRNKNFSNAIIRSQGDEVLLLENKYFSSDSGDKTVRLRSMLTGREVIMGTFNTSKVICRLPRNHDYRLITAETDPGNGATASANLQTTISIFVPRSNVRLQHYCMMQAALIALESKNPADLQLFKNKRYETLVSETAERYSFFAQLKRENIDCP